MRDAERRRNFRGVGSMVVGSVYMLEVVGTENGE